MLPIGLRDDYHRVVFTEPGEVAQSDEETRGESEEPALVQPLAQRLTAPLQVRDRDRYDVLGEHGRGGLGKVARAHDKELGRHVAIKELIKRSDVGEIRFFREALITARLEHPGIVPIHEAGRWPDGTPFYVMKLVAGRSLKELLDERMTVEERIQLLPHVVAVADAVAYAHKRKIIHRDLKPANVIVGDFGETVVIDWGLAKDLSQPDEPAPEAGPYRTSVFADLTETGAVLGTPSYMPPEQFHGEAVDERADVFAIGAMLWEVCSTSKVPPVDPRHRDRLLRKAGIDSDLGVIIAKSLDPEAVQRYRDAGELAADLKSFSSGARIASRRYTLVSMLGHWIRRHRALAITIGVAAVLGIAGVAVSMFNITSARDRAEIEQQRAEGANADLMLENAELLLTRDPTAAMASLANYHGPNHVRRQRLLAEARGRGVAKAVLQPHSDSVSFLVGDQSGAIVSVGHDFRVRVTEHGVSRTLASDVAQPPWHSYSPHRHMLAYVTTHETVALLDTKTRQITQIATGKATFVNLSSDGTRLAIGNAQGELIVWSLVPQLELVYRKKMAEMRRVTFVDNQHLIIIDAAGLLRVSLQGDRDVKWEARHRITWYETSAGRIIAGDVKGMVFLLSSELEVLGELAVCQQGISHVALSPIVNSGAYSCRDGMVGIVNYSEATRSLSVQDSFATLSMSYEVALDSTGRWLTAFGRSKTLYVYDVANRVVTSYEGQTALLSAVTAPSGEFADILAGGVNGSVRVWPLPESGSRVIPVGPTRLMGLTVVPDEQVVVVGGQDGIVRRVDIANARVTELRGHTRPIYGVHANQRGIVSVGFDGVARAWSDRLLRMFSDHGTVTDVAIFGQTDRVASVGEDGRLLVWSMTGGTASTLFQHSAPLGKVKVLPYNQHMVVGDRTGAAWDVSPSGDVTSIRRADGVPIPMLRPSADGRMFAIGTGEGRVEVYDTTTWQIIKSVEAGGGIRQIRFDPKGRDLLVAAENEVVLAVALDMRRVLPWSQLPVQVRDVAYRPDGDVIALLCADGGAWFYSTRNDKWAYVRDHLSDPNAGMFLNDDVFVSYDDSGRLMMRDVSAILRSVPES